MQAEGYEIRLGRTAPHPSLPAPREALRNDDKFCHVAAWEYQGDGQAPVRHEEPLKFDNVHLATRSYK